MELKNEQTNENTTLLLLFFQTHNKMVFHFMNFNGAVYKGQRPWGPGGCCVCLAEGQAAQHPWASGPSAACSEQLPSKQKLPLKRANIII